jgi:ssDNA-specific exonuclease RecJ
VFIFLLINKNINLYKIGITENDFRKKIYPYFTGKEVHQDIKFIMLVDNPRQVEAFTKIFLKDKFFNVSVYVYAQFFFY